MTNQPSTAPVITPAMARRAAAGSFLGAVVEWYDFLLYGVVAALVFAHEFFPTSDPAIGTILSFGTLAVGFVFRPLGGAVFGHYGDKLGPKRMLVITIVMMGLSTVLIGCLPSYDWFQEHLGAGILAPILLTLLRVVQGFAVGGEWGGAALMSVSQAPKHRKAFFSSGVQMGYGVGLILANGLVLVMSRLSGDGFREWGWRVPFLISIVLVAVGLWVRSGVADIHHAQTAEAALQEERTTRPPLVEALTRHPGAFLQIIGIRMVEMFTMYTVTTFALSYSTTTLRWPREIFLNIAIAVGAISLVTIPLFAYVSDRIGRKPVYLTGAVVGAGFAIPFFVALGNADVMLTWLFALILVNIPHDLAVSVQQPLITELFGAQYQNSGAGFGYQVAAVIDGGFTPMIAAAIVAASGGSWHGVAAYLIVGSVISFLVVAFMKPKVPQVMTADEARDAPVR
ncbi:shikimate transporter [Nigerium massiliense]|uniref:shikimate transporter n=1 Tax=Nigerium massiliense TaxID=1522317 RepID=UPI0006949031|nr:shikimate transporter [Nigerium massiliense]